MAVCEPQERFPTKLPQNIPQLAAVGKAASGPTLRQVPVDGTNVGDNDSCFDHRFLQGTRVYTKTSKHSIVKTISSVDISVSSS